MVIKKQFWGVLASVVICVFIFGMIVYATTSIGNNVSISGTLSASKLELSGDLEVTTTGGLFKVLGHATSPNILSGYSTNSVSTNSSYYGNVIFGGGLLDSPNTISAGWFNTITGGFDNIISGVKQSNIIAGGEHNTITGDKNAILGGQENYIGAESWSAIAGGYNNKIDHSLDGHANANYSFISGGSNNQIAHDRSVIVGGYDNYITGDMCVIFGGHDNQIIGDNDMVSYALGTRAYVTHAGNFVWADNNDFDFVSTASNQFAVRSTGGFRVVTAIDGSGNPTQTAIINSSGNFGVDDANPSYKLSVDGTASVSDNMYVEDLFASGVVSASDTNGIMVGGGAKFFGGTASPDFNCTDGSMYIRSGTANEDTSLYLCSPANTWNAINFTSL